MLPGALGDQVDSLVDSPQRRHVHCLLPDDTAGSDSGRVLPRPGHQQRVDKHLQRVPAGQQVDYLEGVPHDTDGLDLFTSVTPVELHRPDQSLDDGTEGLSELLSLVAAGSMRHEDLGLDRFGCNIVDEARIFNLSWHRVVP